MTIERAPGTICSGSQRFSAPRTIQAISPAAPSPSHERNCFACGGGVAVGKRRETKPRALAEATGVFLGVLAGGTTFLDPVQACSLHFIAPVLGSVYFYVRRL